MTDKPNPGSNEAVEAGCSCPRMDNSHGRGAYGGAKGEDARPQFWIREDCPLHALEEIGKDCDQ